VGQVVNLRPIVNRPARDENDRLVGHAAFQIRRAAQRNKDLVDRSPGLPRGQTNLSVAKPDRFSVACLRRFSGSRLQSSCKGAPTMIHEILPVGMLQCNCSIFGDEQTREAIVIDPGDDIADIQTILTRHQLKVKAIVITHAHIDHIGGAAKLKAATGAPVYMNENDEVLYDHIDQQASWLGTETPERTHIDVAAREGDKLTLGSADFQIIQTPGHTQGSISLWIPVENKLIAGDTLFRDSIGRTDLPGGNTRQILQSIANKLLVLPDDAVVIPGHGANTTIGRERAVNPFLQQI
jgi:glyoxylase-like metal-dependent hydrolase (beta-lactamase superfamily II)